MDEAAPLPSNEPAQPQKRRRQWMWPVLLFLLLAAGLVAVAPRLAAVTSFRNVVLKRFIKDWPGAATTESAELGWLTPVVFHNIEMTSREGETKIYIPRFTAESPLWRFVFTKHDLGTIWIDKPSADVIVLRQQESKVPIPETEEVSESVKRRRDPVGVQVEIKDLTVRLRGTEDVDWTTVDGISLSIALSVSEEGDQVVTVAPGVILDHVQITPIMGDAGLMYIAPVMADLAWAKGQFSLELDTCTINVAHPENGELKGRLAIHSVEAGGKNPVLKEMGKFLMTVFPEQMPQAIRFVDDSVIEFQMENEGIRHEGLAFGLPAVARDLVIRLDGWVGFDQSLDLTAEIPIPVNLLEKDPAAGAGSESFEIPIAGTLSEPKASFAEGGRSAMQMVDRLLNRIPAESQAGQQAAEMLRSIGAALKQRRENAPDAPPLGQRMIENGLPKVGRFADQVLNGQKRKNRLNGNNAQGAEPEPDSKLKPKRRGPLKGLFQRNREKQDRNQTTPAPSGPI